MYFLFVQIVFYIFQILAMQFLYNVIEYDMTSCIVTPHQGASLMKIMYKLWSVISIDSVSSSWEDNVNACYLSWLLILTSGLLRHISSNLLSKVPQCLMLRISLITYRFCFYHKSFYVLVHCNIVYLFYIHCFIW